MLRTQKLQQADVWVWLVWTLLIEGLGLDESVSDKEYLFYREKSLGLSGRETILYGWRREAYLANGRYK